jgi:hypothetical protein
VFPCQETRNRFEKPGSGRPEEASELIANFQLEKKRYEERFVAVLDRTVSEILREQRRDTSPLIESLKAAALSSSRQVDRDINGRWRHDCVRTRSAQMGKQDQVN